MLEPELKPYRGLHPAHDRLPARGLERSEVLAEMAGLAEREHPRWADGY